MCNSNSGNTIATTELVLAMTIIAAIKTKSLEQYDWSSNCSNTIAIIVTVVITMAITVTTIMEISMTIATITTNAIVAKTVAMPKR